jgi:hypothetical protein
VSTLEEPTLRCDVCQQDIPASRYRLHERGLDGATPECAKQDLVEIAMRKRVTWSGNEWDAMRARFQNVPRIRLPVRLPG